MTTTTVVPLTQVPQEQRKDDVRQRYLEAGFTDKEYETFVRRQEYQQQYNSRPEVKAARKLYARRRNLKFTMLKQLLQGKEL